MRLIGTAFSPFVRKVRVAAAVRGIALAFDCIAAEPFMQSDADVGTVNPLGKIPALVTEDFGALYDSRVICAFLDTLGDGPSLYGPAGPSRIRVMQLEALADGIADAAVLLRMEDVMRPADARSAVWTGRQAGKIARGLTEAQAMPPVTGGLDIGEIALACHLDWLGVRIPGYEDWRAGFPGLAARVDASLALPAFAASDPRKHLP